MLVQPDYSQSANFNVIPGTYPCQIIGVEKKISQKSGDEYLQWKLETLPDHMQVQYVTMITGRAAGMLKHFMKCALKDAYQDGPFDTDEVIGQIVTMELKVKELVNQSGNTIKVFEVKSVSKSPMLGTAVQSDIPF